MNTRTMKGSLVELQTLRVRVVPFEQEEEIDEQIQEGLSSYFSGKSRFVRKIGRYLDDRIAGVVR